MTKTAFQYYQASFIQQLKTLDTKSITDEAYAAYYLHHLIQHCDYYLESYVEMFSLVQERTEKQWEDLAIIDIGSGNGLLGLFAVYCGCKKVYLNETDPVFLEASKQLAELLHLHIEEYISTDAEQLYLYPFRHQPDVFMGADVIEHIHNLDAFVRSMALVNPSMVSVFTTASNTKNYFKTKRIMRLQQNDELQGSVQNDTTGAPPHQAYLEIRKQIITQVCEHINEMDLYALAQATRGMKQEEIVKAASIWKLTGQLPKLMQHPTNTCHPITGSWTERLLTISEYQIIFGSNHFEIEVFPGRFNKHKKGLKKIVVAFLNVWVFIFGLRLAPFMFIVAKHESPKKILNP